MKKQFTIITSILLIPGAIWSISSYIFATNTLTGSNPPTTESAEYVNHQEKKEIDNQESATKEIYDQFLPTIAYNPHPSNAIITQERIVASTAGIHTLKETNCNNVQKTLYHMKSSNTTQSIIIQQKIKRLEQLGCI